MTLEYHAESPAHDPAEIRARHAENRAAWDQGAARYTEELDEQIEFLRSGGNSLHPIEAAHLGDLAT